MKITKGVQIAPVSVIIISDGDVTIARARQGEVVGTGSARRDPRDKKCTQIGIDLATARALAHLARKLKRRVDGAVRDADNVVLAKAAAAKRPRYVRLDDEKDRKAVGM